MPLFDRIPPQNTEAEQSVLGSILLDSSALVSAMDILQPDDFYRDAHRQIYQAILALSDRGEPVDMITLCEELNRRGSLEAVGGVAYISTLANYVPSAANIEHYARIVKEKATLRDLISAAQRITAIGYEGQDEIEKILDEAEKLIFAVGEQRTGHDFAAVKDILLDAFENIEKVYQSKGQLTGVPSGFVDLDHMTSGFQPSDLIILAARPSMGKSAFALNVALHAAVRHHVPVAIFSLEMSKEQMAQRLLCAEANVDAHRLRTGYIEDEDWPRLTRAVGPLAEAPIFIDDTPGISVAEIRSKARRLKAERGLGLIIIDYLQLIQGRGKSESRQMEISEISRSLKGLARELLVPIISLAQLSRAPEQRQDHRPMLSDLRESGSLEQDADVVMFLYRDEYYNPDTEDKNLAELIIAKQRNGPTGVVKLVWLKQFTKFVNLEKAEAPA